MASQERVKLPLEPQDFAGLYQVFNAPVTALDCGGKCAPYNENGIPFCCDIRHAVPTVFQAEWDYLKANTDLWHEWQAETPSQTKRLADQAPHGQVLLACKGHNFCQRDFRSITCRSFPFFPYLNGAGNFIGLTYYWEYEDRCWVISNLQAVSLEYFIEFIAAYDRLLDQMPEEKETFSSWSGRMRQQFKRLGRSIPLLHRNGSVYKISPANERLRRVRIESLPKFGNYRLADKLPFPDERKKDA